ncbi:MAG TPA: hypothetical protein VGQ00_00160 [Candidatus Norongarragalinales archaeon]|nr:hypothetical protein [Candidatus Norongarragalinales archaeon]
MREGEEPSHGHYAEHATRLAKLLKRFGVKMHMGMDRFPFFSVPEAKMRLVRQAVARDLSAEHLGKHIAFSEDKDRPVFRLHPLTGEGLHHWHAIRKKVSGHE